LCLSLLGKIHDHLFDVRLREFALLLLARRTALNLGRSTEMSP
jgi:hypothetical protein